MCVCVSHHILIQEWGHNLLLRSRNLTRAGNCISFFHMTPCVGVIVCMCVCMSGGGGSKAKHQPEVWGSSNSWPFIDSF